MAIKKEKFFEIIREVSESKDLISDNVLKKVRDKLKEKSDENGIDSPYTIVYNIFKSDNFYKNHEFKLQMQDNTTARGTLLHFAVQCGNALMVKLLLENKVSATMKDHSGLTPWDIATSDSNQEIKQLLLDAKANPKWEKNKDKTPRDIITKANKTPEDLVVNRNNATAALENGNKQTSFNSTDESSDSTVDEQRQSVKDVIKIFESPQRRNTTCSGKQTSTSLNESGNSDDSGICTESEDGEDIDAKNEESKNHVIEYQSKLEALKKLNKENQSLKQKMQDLESEKATLRDKLDKTKSQHSNHVAKHETKLKEFNKENESLRQEIENLKNENTKLKNKWDKTESQHSKTEVLLEKAQKELEESKSCIAGYETKLKEFNKENESLKQEIKNLKNENTTLEGELGKTKTKTNEVSLEKAGKRQFSPKVVYTSLAVMLVVGVLSIASGLSALLIVAASVISALIAGGVTYAISKPTTELKEVDIQGLAQHGVCKT